ncbi:MAG TPA: hypothetical protein VHC22_00175 [Pirellulales bacterium]|nr:hypothetical protein [Pirellulales bacterium]
MASDVESFSKRVHGVMGQSKNKLRVLGVIAAPEFDEVAWNEARKIGLMAINLRQLFGAFALETLCEFESLFKGITGNPNLGEDSDVEHLVQSLALLKTNPLFNELRGLAMEALGGLVLRAENYENVHLALDVPFKKDQTRDVDVLGSRRSYAEWRIIECKAHSSTKRLDPSEVKKFYTETVPAFISWANKKHVPVQKCSAEVWTTGKIDGDCHEALAELKLNEVITPRLVDGKTIRDELPGHIKKRCLMLLNAVSQDLVRV